MRLELLKYSEFEEQSQKWTLDGLRLGPRNLIVGKNAVGKTRTLNVIDALAQHLAGIRPPALSGFYTATFLHEKSTYQYELKYADSNVLMERLTIDGKSFLERGHGGEGSIWAQEISGGNYIRFQTPPNQFAAVARRDAIQHSFLEPLNGWGASVRHYYFGSPLGKENFAVIVEQPIQKPDERDPNAAIALFRLGDREFGEPFRKAIMDDLSEVGYEVEAIGLAAPVSLQVGSHVPQFVGLFVKEKDLPGVTDQFSISQGMFRALALFIHINYCQFKRSASCILIDDIGEGLDFDRSCRLIDRVREKTEDGLIQLVMTTNDRFVMNRVPLEEWSVLQRKRGDVRVRNYENSREIFEDFKFAGLSNFSFLEMDVLGGRQMSRNAKHR